MGDIFSSGLIYVQMNPWIFQIHTSPMSILPLAPWTCPCWCEAHCAHLCQRAHTPAKHQRQMRLFLCQVAERLPKWELENVTPRGERRPDHRRCTTAVQAVWSQINKNNSENYKPFAICTEAALEEKNIEILSVVAKSTLAVHCWTGYHTKPSSTQTSEADSCSRGRI